MFYCLRLTLQADTELLWPLLEKAGVKPLFSSQNEGENFQELFVEMPPALKDSLASKFEAIIAIADWQPHAVDWHEQWETHSPFYKEGKLHIDLLAKGFSAKKGCESIELIPGAGFGDLSHPTTNLALELLSSYAKDSVVIDIGCGSGILTIAAIALGAVKAYGIDIDLAALAHADLNSRKNEMENAIFFSTPDTFAADFRGDENIVIVMNMILTEQKQAWEALAPLHSLNNAILLVSGMLQGEKSKFIQQSKLLGWKIETFTSKDGWLAALVLTQRRKGAEKV